MIGEEADAEARVFQPDGNDQYYELPPAGSALTCIPEQKVEQARFSHSVKNAQQPDKLTFAAVRLFWKWDKEMVMGLKKAAILT